MTPGGYESGFVADVGDFSSGESGRHFSQMLGIHIFGQFDVLEVYFEDGFAPFEVGPVNADLAVEAARAQQGSPFPGHARWRQSRL